MTRTNIKEIASQRFIQVPKLLLYGEEYKYLSGNAFKTYTALYDRFTLSVKNNWLDEDGNIYFVYDLEDLSRITGIGKTALTSARKQLKEAGLLEEVSTGRNNRLYLGLPKPKNKEEAKFIMHDEDEIEDTSKISEEEKALRSRNAKNNQNAKKTDDSSKRTIVRKTPSYQQNDDLEKQTIVQNVLSDSLKRTTSDTNLMKLSKDIKDNKHQTDFQNQQIANQFTKTDKQQEADLIEQSIDENLYNAEFGQETMQLVKTYSFDDYDTFKIYVDKFVYGLKSAEEEIDQSINPFDNDILHQELANTFKRIIIQYKNGKVNNINNYLYVSLKNVFIDFGNSQLNNTDLPPVPLDKWLK